MGKRKKQILGYMLSFILGHYIAIYGIIFTPELINDSHKEWIVRWAKRSLKLRNVLGIKNKN